jgi:uncharacterized delta-60 repeat protein
MCQGCWQPTAWNSGMKPARLGLILLLAPFATGILLPPPIAFAGNITLAWDSTCGASGYLIYYGTSPGQYSNQLDVGDVTIAPVPDLVPGIYYFAVKAYNSRGDKSGFSNEVRGTIPLADTTPPVISNVISSNISASSATISWDTNEATDSQIEYGTTASYASSTALDTSLVMHHSQILDGLAAGTTYHYRLKSKDAAGNPVPAIDFTFTTPPPPDLTPPAISNAGISNITSSTATVIWNTDEASDSQVEYGPTASYGISTALNPSLVTSHSQNLTGLSARTTYHYQIKSLDAAGNLATSADFTFITASESSVTDEFDPGANGSIRAIAVQPDGKILLGGSFTTLGGGGTGINARSYIGRLNSDESLDESFDPGANGSIAAIAVQPDGKILVAGSFTTLGGGGAGMNIRNYIGRLNSDGSLDESFDPGADSSVSAIELQPDGRILVGGSFTLLGGGGAGTTARKRIGRLNSDGSLDESFNPGANGSVSAIELQPDGRILVGGSFTLLGGGDDGTTTRSRIGRLNSDGSMDESFDPGADGSVSAIEVQPDGGFLVGGSFTLLGGGDTGTTVRKRIGRLNSDGSLDTSFDAEANGSVTAIALQADGKILVGGSFTTLGDGDMNAVSRNRIGRFNSDGSLDTSFDAGANNEVSAIALQPDGRILAGGSFTLLGGGGGGATPRSFIGRMTNTVTAQQDLAATVNGRTITWSRSGSSPEVALVTFELSTDGTYFVLLGSAARISGGWQLTGLRLPQGLPFFIRARGFYSSGFGGSSGSVVESALDVFLPVSARFTDFNGDGQPDILWRNSVTGEIRVWYMNGADRIGSASIGSVSDLNWKISGLADFNYDGMTDILWRNGATGENYIWYMDGVSVLGTEFIPTVVDQNWKIAGVADFNNDGNTDILWRNGTTGENYIWHMNGGAVLKGESIPTVTDQNWKIVEVADFNSDGNTDILWRNGATGKNYIWDMNGAAVLGGESIPTVTDQNWKIVGVVDFNGDGKADILWRNAATGENYVWFMNGVTVLGGRSLQAASDMNWVVAPQED